jgi:hypothetical protein
MAAVPERADLFTIKFIIPPDEFTFCVAAETIFTRYDPIIEVFISGVLKIEKIWKNWKNRENRQKNLSCVVFQASMGTSTARIVNMGLNCRYIVIIP